MNAAESLVGAWTLRSDSREILATGEKGPLLGVRPTGTLIYTTDGRMMAMVLSDGRKKPVAPIASDAEALEVRQSVLRRSLIFVEGVPT